MLMKELCCALWVFILLSSLSCAKSTATSALDHAAVIMNEKPDSAKLVLDGIRRSELRTRATRARFALLYSQAMDKCYIDTDNDSLISVALKYYTKHGTDHEKAMVYYYQSVVFQNGKNVEAEVEALINAQTYVEKSNDEYLQALIYHVLANKYYNQMHYDDAIELYKKSAELFTKLENKYNALLAYEGCRNALTITGNLNEATEFGKIALSLAEEMNIVERIIPIRISNYLHSDSKSSEELHSIKQYIIQRKERLGVEQYRYLGDVYENENKIDSALYYYKSYIRHIDNKSHASLGLILKISRLSELIGDKETALEYAKLHSVISGNVYNSERKSLIQDLERKYKAKHIKEEYLALRKQQKLTIIICSLIAFILIIAIVYATHRYMVKIKSKQCEYEVYVAQYETQHSSLEKQYNSLLNTVGAYTKESGEQGFKLVEALENRLESIRTLAEYAYKYGEISPQMFYSKFQEQITFSRNKNDSLSQDILEIADMLNNGFISYLRKQYPEMTKYDLAYCGLILLGFTPDSIRVLYNHTNIQSLYIIRSRIRTKMKLDRKLCLEEYIISLCNKLGYNDLSKGKSFTNTNY